MTHHILPISNFLQSAIAEALRIVSSSFTKFTESKFVKGLEEMGRQRAKQYMIRSTIKELEALSDKDLLDIGITRGEIYDIAHNRNDFK